MTTAPDLYDDEDEDRFALPDEERYLIFLTQAVRQRQVWTLKGQGGFIAFADEEGRPCFPFWPGPSSAAALATGDWSDCHAEPLDLDVFMDRWLRGMAEDGRMVAVFPASDGSGVVIAPETVLADLREEMDLLDPGR